MQVNVQASESKKEKKKYKDDSIIEALRSASYDEVEDIVDNLYSQKDLIKAIIRMLKEVDNGL